MRINAGPIFYVCNDAERAFGLERLIPEFHIICIDDNPLIDVLSSRGVNIFCLERVVKQLNPIFRNSARILACPEVQSYIAAHTPPNEIPNILVFKIAPNIENICQKRGYHLLNSASELNRIFEHKISQHDQFKDIDIPFPKTIIGSLGQLSFDEIRRELDGDFVIQYNRGHTGKSTVFVTEKEVWEGEAAVFPFRKARISKLIAGKSWTINACVTRFGIAYGGLSCQLTGIPGCTNTPGATVGNDWGQVQRLNPEILSHIGEITERVGEKMQDSGYRGLYGIDFVIDRNSQVYFIEVNARQPASTSMHTKLMLEHKEIPLQILHMAEFLFSSNDDYLKWINAILGTTVTKNFLSELIRDQKKRLSKVYSASQLFIRNQQNDAIIVQDTLEPGVYRLNANIFEKVSEGYSIDDIQSQDQVMLLAVGFGHKVSPGSEIARIQTRYSVIDKYELLPKIRFAINNIRKYYSKFI